MTFEFLAVLPLSDLARRPYRGGAGMSEVKAFLSDTGIGHRRFGAIAAGDPLFVRKLRSGASPRLSTVEQVQAWMRANKSALESAPGAQGQDDGEQPMPDRSSDRDRHEEPAEAPADPPPSNDFPLPRDNGLYEGRSPGDPRYPRGRGLAHSLSPHAAAISAEKRRASLPPDRGGGCDMCAPTCWSGC